MKFSLLMIVLLGSLAMIRIVTSQTNIPGTRLASMIIVAAITGVSILALIVFQP